MYTKVLLIDAKGNGISKVQRLSEMHRVLPPYILTASYAMSFIRFTYLFQGEKSTF